MIYQDNTSQVQCSLFLSPTSWKILFNHLCGLHLFVTCVIVLQILRSRPVGFYG